MCLGQSGKKIMTTQKVGFVNNFTTYPVTLGSQPRTEFSAHFHRHSEILYPPVGPSRGQERPPAAC